MSVLEKVLMMMLEQDLVLVVLEQMLVILEP